MDIEPPALAAATARQTPAVRAHLRPHAPVDLSGVSKKRLDKWLRKAPTPGELSANQSAAVAVALRSVLSDAVAKGASYFTANPKLIGKLLQTDPGLAERAGEPELLEPWL